METLLLNNRYRLETRIGEGGFGVTFLATDSATQHSCLIKQLSLQQTDAWKTVELFEREAKTLKHLNHPNIPKYLDYFTSIGQQDRCYYLAQEYIVGKNLSQWIADGRHFTEQEAIAIAVTLAEALTYLHGFSPPLIHRDIKPQNVLLNTEGHVYLVDFGVVCDQNKVGGGSTVAGTFDYMPPEQMKGKTVPASDIYSLGVTLIHLLSRVAPAQLEEKNLRLQFQSHVNISRTFIKILEKMVEPSLERRYRTAADLLADLQLLKNPRQTGHYSHWINQRFITAGLALFLAVGSSIGLLQWYSGKRQIADAQSEHTVTAENTTPLEASLEETLPASKRAILEALQRGASVKTAVAEFFVSTGNAPHSNAELGLPDPGAYQSTALESLTVTQNGVIAIQLNRATVAGGGAIYLKPMANNAAGFVEWKCLSPNLKQISNIARGCAYDPEAGRL